MKKHTYSIQLFWKDVNGTASYTSYSRNHTIKIDQKPNLRISSDPAFRGDPTKFNPEDMFLSSLSSCHMLWYLHLCADSGITVVDYYDNASGVMIQEKNGGGRFQEVVLHPQVIIIEKNKIELAMELHEKANQKCFIANSCNFPIQHVSKVQTLKQ